MADFDPKDVLSTYSDFDEEDIIRKLPKGQDFAPEDVAGPVLTKPEEEAQQEPSPQQKIQKEIEERHWYDRPGLIADLTAPEEIETTAKKHGVDAEKLKELAPYFGVRLKGTEGDFFSIAELKRTAGGLAGTVGAGLPQKLYKMIQDPDMEAALDELQELAAGRQSFVYKAGEIAAPLGRLKQGATLGQIAKQGAIAGGVLGFAGSKAGEEISGTAIGAGIGAAAGPAIDVALKGAGRGIAKVYEKVKSKVDPADLEKLTQETQTKEIQKLGQQVEELKAKNKESDKVIQDNIVTYGREVEQTEAATILKSTKTSEEIAEALNKESKEGKDLLRRSAEEDILQLGEQRAMEKRLAQDVVDDRKREFSEWLTGEAAKTADEADEAILGFVKRQDVKDASYVKKMYDQFLTEAYAKRIIESTGGAFTHAIIRRSDDVMQRTANWISDVQFPLDDITNRTGINVSETNRQLQRHANWMTYPRQFFNKVLGRMEEETRGLGDDMSKVDEGGGQVYKFITGEITEASPAVQKAAQQFTDFVNKVADFVEGKLVSMEEKGWFGKSKTIEQKLHDGVAPVTVPRIKFYAPRIQIDTPVLISRAERRLSQADSYAKQIWKKDLKNLTETEFTQARTDNLALNDLIQYLEKVEPREIKDGVDFLNRYKNTFTTAEGRAKLEASSGRLMERTETPLPGWAREKNVYKLAHKYANSLVKFVYMREPLDKLSVAARTLRRAGAELDARTIDNVVRDVNGIRPGTFSSWTAKQRANFEVAADRTAETVGDKLGLKNEGKEAIANTFKILPGVAKDGMNNIYQVTLGLKPKAIIVNLTQPFTRVMPELGPVYGSPTVLRGAVYALKNMRHMMEMVKKQGLVPAEHDNSFHRALAEGVRRNPVYAGIMKVTNFFGELSMMPYQASETANRLITRGVAEMMAHDIVKGTGNMNKLALQSLKKFPTDIQMAVNAAKGDQAQIAQVLGEHLNSKTMFNYNRPAMSEYGRFMGPLFSQFSKWPTAIAGEAIQDLRSKGLIRGSARISTRLALPYALFSAVDYMIATGGDVEETLKAMVPFSEKPELTDKQKVLTGGSGLAGTTPATSLTGFYSGDMFTPPAVDMLVSKTLIPFLKASDNEERQEALGKGLTNSLKTFTGGMQYIRFFTEEYPVLFEGQSYESVKE